MEPVHLHYVVDGEDFASAGMASSDMKRVLKRIGIDPETVRRASICMYEGEINMVIHACGGEADVFLGESSITIILRDTGPGIPDIAQSMQEGFSTATESVRDLGFGAGMGLPNMKRYSDEITLESEVGVGTTVKMVINCSGN